MRYIVIILLIAVIIIPVLVLSTGANCGKPCLLGSTAGITHFDGACKAVNAYHDSKFCCIDQDCPQRQKCNNGVCTVVVEQLPTMVMITFSPTYHQMTVGETLQFQVHAYSMYHDDYEEILEIQPVWSVNGVGTINAGAYSSDTAGAATITVTVAYNGVTMTKNANVLVGQSQNQNLANINIEWPTTSKNIIGCFSWRVKEGTNKAFFPWIDIATQNNENVYADADGDVMQAGYLPNQYEENGQQKQGDGFGQRVVLKHADGKYTIYGNLECDNIVTVGQKVKKGDKIGVSGDSSSCQGIKYGNEQNQYRFAIWSGGFGEEYSMNPCLFLQCEGCTTDCRSFSNRNDDSKCPR